MTIKGLERATKCLQQIKELDAEIVRIESFALQAANDDAEIKMTLDVVDVKKKAEESNKVKFDEDGSLLANHYFSPSFNLLSGMMGGRCGPMPAESKTAFVKDISNNAALQIFGVLLFELQNKRLNLLQKLENMGFSL